MSTDPAPYRSSLRLLVVALAMLLVPGLTMGTGAAGASPPGAEDHGDVATGSATAGDPDFRLERLEGSDRYVTATAISRRLFPTPGVPVAYVATGEQFPDGLAAGPAGATLGGPVLFVRRNAIPTATRAELDRLEPARIVVVGGSAAVSEVVRAGLSGFAASGSTRVAGATRYDTAAALSAHAFPTGASIAFVATGQDFPDALTGGTAAGVLGGPLLLTGPHSLAPATHAELLRLDPDRIILLGGTGVLPAAVARELGTIAIVERVAGADRYQTALAVSRRVFGTDRPGVSLATGRDWPDALAAGAAVRSTRGPVLLSTGTRLPTGTATELQRLSPRTAYVLGGTASQSIGVPQLVQRHLGTCWVGTRSTSTSQEMFSRVPTTARQMAFTFDMGGRLDPALSIVDYLAANQVCTTFFPAGAMAATAQGRAVLERIARYPHLFEMGNHTYHHCDLVRGGGGSPSAAPCARSMTSSFIRNELTTTESVLADATRWPIRPYWRPPYGSSNATVRSLAAQVGYPKTVMWNRDSADWDPATSTSEIVSRITSPLPAGGSIALFHLGGYHTRAALPPMVSTLRNNGYTLTTISDMRDG